MKPDKLTGSSKAYDIHDNLHIPQWKIFFTINANNKAAFLNFIAVSYPGRDA